MKIPVLLPNIFDHPFTYESDKKVEVGRYVLVPFGKKDAVGVVSVSYTHLRAHET